MKTENDILPEEFELIENYLMQNLNDQQRSEFEQRLNEDTLLKEKVVELGDLFNGIKQAERFNKVEEWHAGIVMKNETITPVRFINYRMWMVAATILIFCAGVWLVFFSKNKEEQLFAKYYKPDYGLITPMGASDNYAFNKAMIDYKTGKYQLAINEWQQQLAQGQVGDTLYYFIGSSYLALRKYGDAAINFKKAVAIPGSAFTGEANWYLGLSQLQIGHTKDAAESIQKSTHPKKEALLNELRP